MILPPPRSPARRPCAHLVCEAAGGCECAFVAAWHGVGVPVSIFTPPAALPEFETLSKNEGTSLARLAPFNHDSRLLRGQRHIRGGRLPVRGVLYTAALVASRYNPVISFLLPPSPLKRQTRKTRPHRLRAKTPHPSQLHPQKSSTPIKLEKTVATAFRVRAVHVQSPLSAAGPAAPPGPTCRQAPISCSIRASRSLSTIFLSVCESTR